MKLLPASTTKHYAIAHSSAIKRLQAGGRGAYGQAHLAFYTSNRWNPYTSTAIQQMRITASSHLLIGTTNPSGYKLAVNGSVRAREVKVKAKNWPDFVFEESYKVGKLEE